MPITNNDALIIVPALTIRIPEIFNDTVAIVASIENEIFGNQFCSGLQIKLTDISEPEYFKVLAPLKKEFIQKVEGEDKLEIQAIKAELIDNLSKLKVTVAIKNAGIDLIRYKEYEKKDIRLILDFPYITLWPYVSLPITQWKEYIVTMKKRNKERKVSTTFVNQIEKIKGSEIRIDSDTDTKSINTNEIFNYKVTARDRNDYKWYYV